MGVFVYKFSNAPPISRKQKKPSEHHPNRCPLKESECVLVEALPILAQASTVVQPGDGAFHNPAPGQHHKLSGIASSHDLDIHSATGLGQSLLEFRPLIASVGVEFQEEWIQSKQCCHQHDAAVTVLDISRMHDGGHHEDVPLPALDLLATVEAGWVDPPPLFRHF